jgi:lysophospholipase L1-like esterase
MKRPGLFTLLVCVLIGSYVGAQKPAAGEHWVATWGTAQQLFRAAGPGRGGQAPPARFEGPPSSVPPGSPAASAPGAPPASQAGKGGPQRRFGIPPSLPGLNDQTVRMIVRVSVGGSRLRVRLFNALGGGTVAIGAAHVAVRGSGAAVVPGSDRALTFSGMAKATMYAGQVLVSDPVRLDVQPLADLAVSLYLPGDTAAPTSHTFGLRPAYVSRVGDFSAAADIPDPVATMQSYYWLAGIDIAAPADAATIVTFGDSITDGDQSTPDTNGMWPALLSARLQRDKRTSHVAVVNAGISGNRILGDNNGGLARLVPHALSVPGVKWITLLEGINDITAATRPAPVGAPAAAPFSAEDLIGAYRQVIELAHLQGVKVIGCTLTPFGGSTPYSEQGESIRQKTNTWVRTSGAFDAVVDFDRVTRDPANPTRFRAEADSPDMLHPGDAGYRLMAEAFDLAVFAGPEAKSRVH